MTIPRDVPEDALVQLFQSDSGSAPENLLPDTVKCARVVPCRSGAKGKRMCRE